MSETAEERADRWYKAHEQSAKRATNLAEQLKERDEEIAKLKEQVTILKLAVKGAMSK